MIDTFTRAWFHSLHDMRAKYTAKAPENYAAIVKDVVTLVRDYMAEHSDEYEKPDPDRITAIDHGSYQGTILFIVAADDYQPSKFWMSFVNYGSCSYCDTLQSIYKWREEGDPVPTDEVDQYLALALHILQSFKSLPGPYDE